MTRGGGGVQTPPKKDDIIDEQPLIIHKFIFFGIFQVSGSNKTQIPEVTKLLFTFHLLVGLMQNSTTAIEP